MNLAEEWNNRAENRAPEDRERPVTETAEAYRAPDSWTPDEPLTLSQVDAFLADHAGQLDDRLSMFLRLIDERHPITQVSAPNRIETVSMVIGTEPKQLVPADMNREWVQISTADQPVWVGPRDTVEASTAANPSFSGGFRISNIISGPYIKTTAELWVVALADTAVCGLAAYHD